MKPTNTLKPNDYAYQDLLIKFSDGIPLSCNQLNFLDWHEKTLSNSHLDPVLKYYLKHYRHRASSNHSFLLPHDDLKQDDIIRLKNRLNLLLNDNTPHLELTMTPAMFLQFRSLTYQELILYHGNQLLTGAPFHQGGIPQLILFQWGNLFGVAKYVILAEEKALKSNVLIYFEDMRERLLDECVLQYTHKLQDELKQHHQLAPVMQPRQKHIDEPVEIPQSAFKTPTLTLSLTPFKAQGEEE